MEGIEKVYLWIEGIIKAVICALLCLMVIIVFANVVSRYYLESSLAWSEEIARFMLIWLVFLGAVVAYQKDEHLGLDIFVKQLPLGMRRIVAVVIDLLVLFSLGLLVKGGFWMMTDSWAWLSPATDTPYGKIYLIIPLTCGLMFLQTLIKIYKHLTSKDPFPGGTSC